MEIVSYCPKCFKGAAFPGGSAPAEVVCARCGERREVTMTESVAGKNVVDRCVLCGCGHLYLEKDFNGYVGCGIIGVAITASMIAWGWENWYAAIGILAGAAVLDLAVWRRAGDRTICYRCVAAYRGAERNPAHGPYDLGTAGRFADDYDEQRRRRPE